MTAKKRLKLERVKKHAAIILAGMLDGLDSFEISDKGQETAVTTAINLALLIEDELAVRRCGHCGAKPRIVGRKADGYYVACLARDCRQPATCCHKTRQGAIDEWNEETV